MVKISLDEAAALDMLSILEVKLKKADKDFTKSLPIQQNIGALSMELKNQISLDLLLQIYESEEYKRLRGINQLIFDLVDKSKINECSPKELDEANYARHVAKQNLQKKFFTNVLTETKLGYENISGINN